MVEQSLPPTQPTDPSSSGQLILTPQEWEEIADCSTAFFDALMCLKETGQGLELLESVQKRLGRRVHLTANRLAGERQSFEERSEDDDGIPAKT